MFCSSKAMTRVLIVTLSILVSSSNGKLYSLPSAPDNTLDGVQQLRPLQGFHVPPAVNYLPCRDNFTVACFRSKTSAFLDRLDKIEELQLWSWLRVVRSSVEPLQRAVEPAQSSEPLDLRSKLEGYMSSHSFRISLPDGITAATSPRSAPSPTIDINMATAVDTVTGRRKKNKSGMGMYMMGLMGKLGMMGMALIKLKAIKALMISLVALILSKIQLFKMLASKGGGSEHVIVVSGGHGGGGGGGGYGHGGGGGGFGGGHDSYGPPSGGGGWSSGGSSGGYSSGGDHYSGGGGGGGGGYSYGGGGGGGASSHGGGSDWQSGGGGGWNNGGGNGGGWNSGGGGGGGGGGGWSSGSSGGWSKRNYQETETDST